MAIESWRMDGAGKGHCTWHGSIMQTGKHDRYIRELRETKILGRGKMERRVGKKGGKRNCDITLTERPAGVVAFCVGPTKS